MQVKETCTEVYPTIAKMLPDATIVILVQLVLVSFDTVAIIESW